MTKRLIKLNKQIEKDKLYQAEEAIALVKKLSTVKFDESVEIHIRTRIDPKRSEQLVRGSVSLPHGTGKTIKIAVFAEGEKEKEAKDAGADITGGQDLIDKIKKTEKTDFDIALATPDMMPKIAVIAKTLGTRGLMPSPKNETVTTNIKKGIEDLKKGKVTFKNDETANIHVIIGKVSFDDKKLIENFDAFIEALQKSKPSSVKAEFIRSVTITSSMGPGIKVDVK
jgi:large subunit ribosomal protein L1